jgi:3-isopropylmalate/(R)-2-methylmalate dehydratase small subunit
MSDPFITVRGAAAPLLRANIDTDTISPGSRQAGRAPSLAGDLFAGLRYDAAGNENPDFVLNRPEFREAKILLAGANFGCGSSRESAVWMLKAWGLRCIIAPSFGEIFHGNCFKNGVLPIVLDEPTIALLAREAEPGDPDALFDVDLIGTMIWTPSGRTIGFELPKIRRDALLGGLDEIEQTLAYADAIERFEAAAASAAPWTYRVVRSA